MSQAEITQLWTELRDIRRRVDRLFWVGIITAVAIGGDKVVERLLSLG